MDYNGKGCKVTTMVSIILVVMVNGNQIIDIKYKTMITTITVQKNLEWTVGFHFWMKHNSVGIYYNIIQEKKEVAENTAHKKKKKSR